MKNSYWSVASMLVLEDGTMFLGKSIGAAGEVTGEVVFNTSMTGYQEILTDPSYTGQMVCLTYPLIGNYGINDTDIEALAPCASGLIIRELSQFHSNWRSTKSLGDYLQENNIIAIDEIDTRALTKHIRMSGAQMGIISTKTTSQSELLHKVKRAQRLDEQDLVKRVTVKNSFVFSEKSKSRSETHEFHVVAIDLGVKLNILRNLSVRGCKVTVVPATISAQEIIDLSPDGLFLSNGPGDPIKVPYLVKTIRYIIKEYRELPIFGICLGHQVLGISLGAKTYKLKFGHHGGNHPVKEISSGLISITSQNHGYAIDSKLLPNQLIVTHINLNDQTIEGFRHQDLPIFAIQYHPEAAPGPHDAEYLFDRFVSLMKSKGIDSGANQDMNQVKIHAQTN